MHLSVFEQPTIFKRCSHASALNIFTLPQCPALELEPVLVRLIQALLFVHQKVAPESDLLELPVRQALLPVPVEPESAAELRPEAVPVPEPLVPVAPE